jgi:hypothetical protein
VFFHSTATLPPGFADISFNLALHTLTMWRALASNTNRNNRNNRNHSNHNNPIIPYGKPPTYKAGCSTYKANLPRIIRGTPLITQTPKLIMRV